MSRREKELIIFPLWFCVLFLAGINRVSAGRAGEDRSWLLAQAGTPSVPQVLGSYYRDTENGFAIQPPHGWLRDSRNPKFLVKFTSTDLQAFIIIDLVKLASPITFDPRFTLFIAEKNREVARAVPSFRLIQSQRVNINPRLSGYMTSASFLAGDTRARMNIYYIPFQNKLFMISTVYPEAAVQRWSALVKASIASFMLLK